MFTLDIDGEIRGKLSIGTATLNSLGLKDKASLMPMGGDELKSHQLFRPLFPPKRNILYQFYRYLVVL